MSANELVRGAKPLIKCRRRRRRRRRLCDVGTAYNKTLKVEVLLFTNHDTSVI